MTDLSATTEDENFQKNSLKTYGLLTSVQLKSKGQCEKSKLKQLNFFCKKPNGKHDSFCLSFENSAELPRALAWSEFLEKT